MRNAQRAAVWLGVSGALAMAACGPLPTTSGGDGGSDAAADAARGVGPCALAERSAPDFSREASGAPSMGDDAQRAALLRANHWRTAAGLTAFDASPEIEQAALAHGTFMASNPRQSCWPGVHNELASGCTGFTGTMMSDRMLAAGYRWSRASEVINWEPDAASAVDGWLWTVYHRQPFMDYRLVHAGFGRAHGPLGNGEAFHNVMDFGAPPGGPRGTPPAHPAVFPLPGMTDVPRAFRGDLEGPTPPAPGGGTGRWPAGRSSGTVVSVHFPTDQWAVTHHALYLSDAVAGTCTEVTHTFVSRDTDPTLNPNLANPGHNYPTSNDVFWYADEALSSQTEYVAQIEGTVAGASYSRTWAFTTH